jgi:hypothetical protein
VSRPMSLGPYNWRTREGFLNEDQNMAERRLLQVQVEGIRWESSKDGGDRKVVPHPFAALAGRENGLVLVPVDGGELRFIFHWDDDTATWIWGDGTIINDPMSNLLPSGEVVLRVCEQGPRLSCEKVPAKESVRTTRLRKARKDKTK